MYQSTELIKLEMFATNFASINYQGEKHAQRCVT
jgi:hypothetical protein